MIHLDTDHLGRLVLLIEDAGGEPQYYSFDVKPYAVLLCRQDTRDLYSLRRTPEGWSCSCKAFTYRRNKTDCKHTSALRICDALRLTLSTMQELIHV